MSSARTEIITVRKIKGKPIVENSSDSFDIEESSDNRLDEESYGEQSEIPNNLLCILCRLGKLGAAYYNFTDKQLYVYEEMLEAGPQYLTTVSLFREIQPKYILTIGGKSEIFVRILSEIITYGESCLNSTTTTDTIPVPKNLFLVSSKEYNYEICKAIISQLQLASIVDEPTDTKREVYIHSLINFDNRLSIQAIGTLVKFLEKNWTFFGITEKTELCYIHINQISRKDHVLVDNSTFQALQIFSKRAHDSGFKRGLYSSEREGLSLYKLFSLNCKSKVGLLALKNVLLNPLNNINILNKRLDFIEFVLDPSNREFVESLRDNLRLIASDINVILTRIENSMAKFRDWHVLYKTIYHTIFLKEISSPYIEKCSILMELYEKVSDNLLGLEKSINNGLDFDASKKRGKPIIKYGLDNVLDEKKLRRQDIINDVMAAARFAAENLPDFLDECSVVYIPEMGHLLAIKEWEPDCIPEDLQHLGFQFVFKIGGRIHYKNPMCIELDKRLGDTISEIIDHENRILRRLSGFVIKYNRDIREPLKIIGLIDCLISMAITASTKLFVRPSLNQENYFEMEECRHPLMEEIVEQFQPNDFYSGGPYSRMKIITGPNSSGKSVYLKEVSLVIYMAHVGSFVPCAKANINLLDSIHTRLLATESVAVRLSSFMIDLTQMSHALMDISRSSLVFLDEFGKGTTEIEGIALLEGALKHFLSRGLNCPHVVVATHFQKIRQRLPESSLIQFQKMEHTNENGVLYFLYKISEGVSNSFAIDVAEAIGIDKEVIERARYFYNCIVNEEPVAPLEKILRRNNFDPYNFEKLNIPEPDEDGPDSDGYLQHLEEMPLGEDNPYVDEDVMNIGEDENNLLQDNYGLQQDEYELQEDNGVHFFK